MMKKVIQNFLESRGYLLFRDTELAMNERFFEASLKRLFARIQPTMVIDVGGNRGQYRDVLRNRVDYAGPICTFEPIPDLVQAMTPKVQRDPNWTVFAYALGASAENKVLNVMQSEVFSSFLDPNHDQATYEGNKVKAQIEVPVRRLDSFIEELAQKGSLDRVFLKLDTQGFDLQVFKGAKELLPHLAGLQSEVSMVPIYIGMPGFVEAIGIYEAAGFDVAGLCPVTSKEGRVIEFDCLMLKQE